MKGLSTKQAAYVIGILFLLSLIPIILISFYSFPCADDFQYGAATAQILSEGGSLQEVLQTAIAQTKEIYASWQGSYSAVFLMQLQPAAFGADLYFLTCPIMLISLVSGTMLFLREVLIKRLDASLSEYFLITSVLLFFSINNCYFPAEGFYWFNGGIYYTFFYGMAFIMLSLVLASVRVKELKRKVMLCLGAICLAIIVAGGNYTTALVSAILLAFGSAFLFWKKDKGFWTVLTVFGVFIVFFLLSISAPGNGIRQAGVGGAANPLKAIILSFILGGYIFLNSLKLPVVIAFLCLIPILLRITKRSHFRFRQPLLFTAFSLCAFCAQCTPPLYALGINVPERLLNIIYFSFYPLVLLNLLYWCGYFSRKNIQIFSDSCLAFFRKYSAVISSITVMLVLGISIGACKIEKSEDGVRIGDLPFSMEAALELTNGSAAGFRQEHLERIQLYQNNPGSDLEVPELTEKPHLLYINDITADPADWRNASESHYWGLSSVKTKR